jgi:hypothetical protein
VSLLFVAVGSVLVLGGIGLVLDEKKLAEEQMHPAIAVGIALVGLAGAIGGVAALRGSRRWAPLVYVMAALYVFGFPIGTILSIVMFRGLSRYLVSVERIRAPMVRDAEHLYGLFCQQAHHERGKNNSPSESL